MKRVALALAAALVLNALLSMGNWWPTPMVRLQALLAPEFVGLWLLILVLVHVTGALSVRMLNVLAAAYFVLVLGRYFDVTAPALFGRNVNLYWDALQIPRVMWVTLRTYPIAVSFIIVLGIVGIIWGTFAALRVAIRQLAANAAPFALARPWALAISLAAAGAVLLNASGQYWTATFIATPVTPTYARQGKLLVKTLIESQSQTALPPSPAFDSDLSTLAGADVNLFLLESYGMLAFTNPSIHAKLAPSRAALAQQIERSGLQVVSASVGSTTFGGGSELAQLSFLSGLDTSDPLVHDLLLTTSRPTLVSFFKKQGYDTFGIYPALSWDWPERRFYGYDTFIDSRDMNYTGPKLGFWTVPDQYSLAWLDKAHPITATSAKRMTLFASITSHMPFHPVPPYVQDWPQILSVQPFSDAQMALVNAQKEDWLNMQPAYIDMIAYNYQWLAGYLAQPKSRDSVHVWIGDHQPAANVTGQGVGWDVPVHVASANPELLKRLQDAGFKSGLQPRGPSLGKLFDLTQLLLEAFGSPAVKAVAPR